MFIATIVAAVLAQAPAKPPIETAHLLVATSAGAVARGGKVTLQIDVTPKPKMHVYAPGQDGYIVVTLTLEKNAAFTAAAPKFPAPEKLLFEPLNETQLVYSKPFRIVQDIRRTKKGPLTVKGTLRYQACDDAVCFRPTNVPVEWTVK